MYLADYHTHSRLSPDGRASMAEMARAAYQAGLHEICFTDHVEPISWGTGALRPLPYDWGTLSREFQEARAEMGDRMTLRLGIELGDAVQDFAHTEKLLEGCPDLDFVIGSIHMLSSAMGDMDLYNFQPRDEEEAHAGIRDYLEQVRRLTEWDGPFSVLGHLTLPLRYLNELRGFHLTFDGYEKEVEQILRSLIAKGRGLELNSNRGNDPLPGAPWLKMYRELGGEIITIGSDAHVPAQVGCFIRERRELLKQCGFTKFCTFEKMQPIWHKL